MSDTLNLPKLPSEDAARVAREARAWLIRLRSGRATEDDALAFRRWCDSNLANASAFAHARQVWQAVPDAAANLAWASVQPRRAQFTPTRRHFIGGAVAASVAYLALRPPMGLWPAVGEYAADYRTGTGEQRQVVVSQGLMVQMNTQTRIDMDSGVEGETSLKLVAGEAEFQAEPFGRSSRVNLAVGDGEIRSSRARFNVRHTDSDVCVTCLAGEVQVARGSQRTTLSSGAQVTFGADTFGPTQRADETLVSAWRKHLLVFNNEPLSTVVAEVNRYRPGKIILTDKELGKTQVQASLSTQRLDDVISLIRGVYGADVTLLPGGVVLVGRA